MTAVPSFDPDMIPAELRAVPQWVAWGYATRQGKETKLPINVHTGRLADSSAPFTWGGFARALEYALHYGLGVGFVFGKDDPYAGVDLDRCIDAGRILPWAWDIVQALDSYTEVSPSGLGLKVIVRGALPPGRRGWGDGNGMYDRARFFTLTGWRLEGTPAAVEGRGEALAALHARLFPPAAPRMGTDSAVTAVDLDDAEIVRRAMGAKNGAKFSRLWLGEWSDYASRSEADMALCSMLAFWCGGDAGRVGRLFEQSGLFREGKWNRASYRERTIERGNQRAEYYTPRPRQGAGSADRSRLILGRAGG